MSNITYKIFKLFNLYNTGGEGLRTGVSPLLLIPWVS